MCLEPKHYVAHSAVSVLGYYYLGHAVHVLSVVFVNVVVFRAVDEAYYVGILLYCARFAQVAQLRAFAFVALTCLDAAVQLRQGKYGNVQLFCQLFQGAAYVGNFLLAASEIHAACVHELKVVYHYQSHLVLTHKAACLGAQFEY